MNDSQPAIPPNGPRTQLTSQHRAPQHIFAEDIELGVRYDAGSHAVTEGEIVEFAAAWDPQFFHVDPEAAAAGYFGGVIASGIHTLAIFQRLATTAHFSRWNVIAGTRIRDLRFLRPVMPGDVLVASFIVDHLVLDDRARADVRILGRLDNRVGVTVLDFAMDTLIRSRHGNAGKTTDRAIDHRTDG